MRSLSTSLAAKLDAGVTTMAYAWRLIRTDGLVVAVTEHDCDLNIDGTLFSAARPFRASDHEAAFNLAPDRTALTGALSIGAITDADLMLGHWDGAKVEALQVDWLNPSDFIIKWVGKIGGVSWRGNAFELDIVGPEASLNTEIGRTYARTCDAVLGDGRCKVDLTSPQRFVTAAILALLGDRQIKVLAPVGKVAPDFVGGTSHIFSGVTQGWRSDISAIAVVHATPSPFWNISLARPFPLSPTIGDSVTLSVGCDKQFATCKTRFANALNFRGQHTLPGDDVAFGGPAMSGNNGGKR